MKNSQKFLFVFLAITILFSGVIAVVSSVELNSIKQNSNIAILQIIAQVKEDYPDISDDEIAQIINSKADTAEVEQQLKKYGIRQDDWIILKNEGLSFLIVIINMAICAVACLSLCAVYVIYCKNRKKQTEQITNYVSRLNQKHYDLYMDENSEDDLSLLKNEIYKTTVMLKEQSENSNKDKEMLKDSLSDISHQLKTPLTSMMVMLDNITDDEEMPAEIRRDFINDIHRETNNISFLVQSILTLSKLDANSIAFKPKNETLSNILTECAKNTAVLAELREVNVEIKSEELVFFKADFRWLCEAITNIVKNCIEHTNAGGTVKLCGEQNKMYTKITVSDNGCGIDPNDLPHIFERFYKGKNSDDSSVGIGLALAKTIIEKGGGFITVDSELGKGTTFDIKFFHDF